MPGATFELPLAYDAEAVQVSDGVMDAGGSNPYLLTSATAAFTPFFRDRRIIVAGAGAAGGDLETRISTYISATQVVLDDPALTDVSSADLTFVNGVYRLSDLLAGEDVDGNTYQLSTLRRLQLQIGSNSPGGSLFVGGPFVTTTNFGIELQQGVSDGSDPWTNAYPLATSDYLTSDTAAQMVNIYWQDDFNIAVQAAP